MADTKVDAPAEVLAAAAPEVPSAAPAIDSPAKESESSTDAGAATDAPAASAAEKRPRDEKEQPTSAHHGKGNAKRVKIGLDISSDRGVLFTCANQWFLKKSGFDLLRALKEHGKKAGEKEDDGEKAAVPENETAEQALEREKKELEASEAKHKMFFMFDDLKSVPTSCGFIKFEGSELLSPTEACSKMLDNKALSNRNVCRLLPLDRLCKPHLADFQKLAEEVIKPLFDAGRVEHPDAEIAEGDDEETKKKKKAEVASKRFTWAVHFKPRNNSSFKKDKVLEVIDKWTDGFKVSIEKPDVMLQIELSSVFCGISLIKDWEKQKKYNVQTILNGKPAVGAH